MQPFVAIDFETSHRGRDSACAVGLVRAEEGKIVAKVARLIRPPLAEVLFSWVHGLTWDDLHDQPGFAEVWRDVSPLLDGVGFMAAHNASFDSSVLRASCTSVGLAAPTVPFVCTVKVARQAWDLRPTKLPDVARHLGVALDHHNALSDAEVCAHAVLAAPETVQAMLPKACR